MARSACVPVEVIIHSRDQLSRDFRRGARPGDLHDESVFFDAIFRHLQDNMHRVQSLHVQGLNLLSWTPDDDAHMPVYERVLDLLRVPTPALINLRVSFDTRPWHWDSESDERFWLEFPAQPFPMLLPHAPQLRELSVAGAPIICRRPHPGLASLRYLRLVMQSMHAQHLHDMLAVAPYLEHLYLCVEEVLHATPNAQPTRTSATHITTLEIDFGESFNLLSGSVATLPNLSHLVLPDLRDISVNSAVVERIKKLKVYAQNDLDEHIDILRLFKQVEDVEFGSGTTMRRPAFITALLEESEPMWPHLRTLKMFTENGFSAEEVALMHRLTERHLYQVGAEISVEVTDVLGTIYASFPSVFSS